MTPHDFKAAVNPNRELVLSGPGLAELLDGAAHYELWHSQPDQGLAVHFIEEPSGSSQPLPPLDPAGSLVIEAAGFMAQTGIGRAADGADLTVRAVDEARRILSINLGQGGAKSKPGVLDDYEAL